MDLEIPGDWITDWERMDIYFKDIQWWARISNPRVFCKSLVMSCEIEGYSKINFGSFAIGSICVVSEIGQHCLKFVYKALLLTEKVIYTL